MYLENLKNSIRHVILYKKYKAIKFIDGRIKAVIVYIPEIEVSGYGRTFAEAISMIYEQLTDEEKRLIKLKR
jgi:hypothetical protein